MAPKSLVLAALLVAVAVVAGFVPQRAAAAGTSASVSTSVRISGVVPCSTGSSIDVNTVPAFPNAGLQLVCSGKVVTGATADGTGAFLINLPSVTTNMITVLMGNQCKLVVTTPLAACDASLAGVTGTMTAPLKLLVGTGTGSGGGLDLSGIIGLIGQIVGGLIGGILNLVPQAFSVV